MEVCLLHTPGEGTDQKWMPKISYQQGVTDQEILTHSFQKEIDGFVETNQYILRHNYFVIQKVFKPEIVLNKYDSILKLIHG